MQTAVNHSHQTNPSACISGPGETRRITPPLQRPSTPTRNTSQETVRPNIFRSSTMPSIYAHETLPVGHEPFPSSKLIDMFPSQGSATAPASPSGSSTSGSYVGSFSSVSSDLPNISRSPSTIGNESSTPTKNADDNAQQNKIARPPNAWILYRSRKLAEYKESNPKLYASRSATRSKADRGIRPTQASFSESIARQWASEPASVKEYYHNEACLRSMMHAVENPGYRFNPNKCRKEKPRKEKVSPKKSKSPSTSRPRNKRAESTPSTAASYSPSVFQSPTTSNSSNYSSPQSVQQSWIANDPVWSSPPLALPTQAQPIQVLPDVQYAQERKPSLLAQWDAIFPGEPPCSALSSSSFSSSFSSAYSNDSTSPGWTNDLLPSLSISETPYLNQPPSVNGIPFDENLLGNTFMYNAPTTPVSEVSNSLMFATVPALTSPTPMLQPQYGLWSVPTEEKPTSTMVNNNTNFGLLMEPPTPTYATTFPEWWPYRRLKVKPDELEGVPLEDLLRGLEANKQQ